MGLPAVGARGEHRRDRLDPEVVGGAAIAPHLRADPGEAPVAVGPELQVEDLGAGGVGGGEVLAARHHQPDGPAEHERGADDQRLDDHQLAAEAATERRGADANPVGRQPEQLHQLSPRRERPLRRRGDDELVVLAERGGGGLGLEIALVDPRRVEAAADDDVAAGERGVDVAVLEPGRAEHVL